MFVGNRHLSVRSLSSPPTRGWGFLASF